MPDNKELKETIQTALTAFEKTPLAKASLDLLGVLGYRSERRLSLKPNNAKQFQAEFDANGRLNPDAALVSDWTSVDLLIQITDDEIREAIKGAKDMFASKKVDYSDAKIYSYLFFALELKGDQYTRTQLAGITREINKLFPMPVMVIFKYNKVVSLAIIARRINKKDAGKDVLEKVTLIKDIRFSGNRAQIEILHDLSITQLMQDHEISNFVDLQKAWEKTLDLNELNKKFYKEIANWYFWAVKIVKFPRDAEKDEATRNATGVIRLITRLIFVWFIKEKGLVPEDWFDARWLKDNLDFSDTKKSTYYKAILQNLFFATLNTEMGEGRMFRRVNTGGLDPDYLMSNYFRYKQYFTNTDTALKLFAGIPFLNGGLFECLDKEIEKGNVIRVDGFSDRDDNPLTVPDKLFLQEKEEDFDLNEVYDTKNKKYKVRGLIHIFNSYKFTIEENTPIEEEIALDPELLGKVFENLLAAYNPETGTTARKQTGSFYTPREIVNYMVDEALVAYLNAEGGVQNAKFEERWRDLLSYNPVVPDFTDAEKTRLIAAIDNVKVLDPAAGSGAFPMGVLHKLVFLLGKLDPNNEGWKQRQLDKAYEMSSSEAREAAIKSTEDVFENNHDDYGRKLYLIENCIYGVDIQPIAVQIAKLRFFISLVVDQKTDAKKPNLGILPLPNLETKFVAANTLIGINEPEAKKDTAISMIDHLIRGKRAELKALRHEIFRDRHPKKKREHREQDKNIRFEIVELLKGDWGKEAALQLAGWDPYNQNAHADFFDPEWMFGIEGGFDVVIGNPPYIQLSKVEGVEEWYKQYLKARYKTSGGRLNTFIFFIHLALEILKKNGSFTYIIPNTILTQEYYSATRELLLRENSLKKIVQYSELPFETAVVENVTILARKERMAEYWVDVYTDDLLTMEILERKRNTEFLANNNFVISVNSNKIIDSIFSNHKQTLDELCEINQAIALKGDRSLSLRTSNPKGKYYKKLDGKNIGKYSIEWDGVYLDWDLERIHSCKRKDIFQSKEKLFFRRVSEDLMFAYDNEQYFALNTLVVVNLKENVSVSLKYLLSLLNSQLMNYIYKGKFKSTKTVFSEIQANTVGQLPIPDATKKIQNSLETLVTKILAAKRTDPAGGQADAPRSAQEGEIDQLVYQLYGLSEDEIKIVENKT